ncbi:uncharacterized protein LOC131166286 [Malania oleifera]|uniref:uncharacterized protein LOC131166286 n=1 Tax=Malania oleifera TaxID=397392 RepID=UPI0025AEB2AC|nr:uncharacterized protein LOC131166286 [Malania oleifera]
MFGHQDLLDFKPIDRVRLTVWTCRSHSPTDSLESRTPGVVSASSLAEEREREMGGKGRRRREKNYRAAHGGYSRLPPPPDPNDVDAVPSKLLKIMAFASSSSCPSAAQGSARPSMGMEQRKKIKAASNEKKLCLEVESGSNATGDEERANDGHLKSQLIDNCDEMYVSSTHEMGKKKRKRKKVNDLRFEMAVELGAARSKRRDAKKKYLEAKKKKHKKGKADEILDFSGHEKIKFGDVVEAPPKLDAIPKPKALRTVQDASRERLHLQAVEAYRNRKEWVSRPGIHLPPVTTSPSL